MIPEIKMKYVCFKNEDCVIMEKKMSRDVKKFDVLVEIVACGISAADCESRPNHLNATDEYQTLGSSISGIVQSIGSGVKTLRVGDNVAGKGHTNRLLEAHLYTVRIFPGLIAQTYKQSGCGEYVIMEEYDLVRIPDGVNLMDVAACVGDCIQAYIALFYCSKVVKDEIVLILNGAVPSVSVCVQVAQKFGVKVLCVCSSAVEKVHMEAFNGRFDGIIDLSESENVAETLYSECMKRTDNLGVDVVLDLQCMIEEIFPLNSEAILSCLTIHGRWVTRNSRLQLDPPNARTLFERCASICFLNEQAWLISKIAQGKYQHILTDIVNKVKSNVIRPPHFEIIEFSSLPHYFSKLRNNKVLRLVVVK